MPSKGKLVIQNIEDFNQQFESYYEWSCAVATVFVHDIVVAEDIAAESFIALWNKRDTIHTSLRPYLLKIIRNKALNHIRHLKAQQQLKENIQEKMLDYQEELILQMDHPFSYVDRKEVKQIIEDAIEKLPAKCRQIFLMNHMEEKSYKEISEKLDITENTIKTQMRIAYGKLRELLKDKFVFLFVF
ncbi:MAG: RNA polymerase sigma-70 factor [Bacteroidales bacterium]|nr:RNA polymerase sigma-70 factor [Bacteroidales bacterium]